MYRHFYQRTNIDSGRDGFRRLLLLDFVSDYPNRMTISRAIFYYTVNLNWRDTKCQLYIDENALKSDRYDNKHNVAQRKWLWGLNVSFAIASPTCVRQMLLLDVTHVKSSNDAHGCAFFARWEFDLRQNFCIELYMYKPIWICTT